MPNKNKNRDFPTVLLTDAKSGENFVNNGGGCSVAREFKQDIYSTVSTDVNCIEGDTHIERGNCLINVIHRINTAESLSFAGKARRVGVEFICFKN